MRFLAAGGQSAYQYPVVQSHFQSWNQEIFSLPIAVARPRNLSILYSMLSAVIPVYNEVDSLDILYRELTEVAREQDALFWELRLALSLARVRVTRGRRDEARRLLAPVYERFTEGFDTNSLKEAKAMLEALRS